MKYNRLLAVYSVFVTILLVITGYFFWQSNIHSQRERQLIAGMQTDERKLRQELQITKNTLQAIESQDQVLINKTNTEEIKHIHDTYNQAVSTYEQLLQLKETGIKTDSLDELFTQSLSLLSDKQYASASSSLASITKKIAEEKQKAASTFQIPQNIVADNTAPSAGYRRQKVSSTNGEYLVDIVSADLNSTRVIVDTASDSDCKDNCPVLSLGDYVSRSGGFAGINGSYFCPASYPSCAGKTNSFDTLLMNKNKKYFNSDNNVYSSVPAVIFSSGSARFVSQSSQWGRDTGVDGVIANQPLLVLNGQNVIGGDADPKRVSKGSRSFVGSSGSTVYIGVVHNASAAEVAQVLQTMGIQNALNLDSGGSTALWSGGYKVGPGRNIPNAIIFVRR